MRYVGEPKFSKGIWIGIEYDEPIGKNDGSCVLVSGSFPISCCQSVQGERYFTCSQNYGVFVRPDKVKVGDYPVEELELEDEEM